MATRGEAAMKNDFFSLEPKRGEMPRRVFALFDQRSDESIFMESVNADWFTDAFGFGGGFDRWMEMSDRAPIYVLELPSGYASQLKLPYVGGGSQYTAGEDEDEPAIWFEIYLNPTGEDAQIYHGLFAEPQPVAIERINEWNWLDGGMLNKAFGLAPFKSSKREIENSLVIPDPVEWIGVYDVGQGSANGICDREAFPLAYFDLGGGVLANKRTFPSAFQNICTTRDPKVVLSHWDWDHWSSAARFPESQQLTWIVPNQTLGAVHATMAAGIALQGRLLVWPDDLPRVQVNQITIEKCTGRSGRNHTGLAMIVDGPNGELPILLTGDARYSAIPGGFADYLSIVASHHGADMKSKATPICPKDSAARIAYSYGQGNTFGHPRDCTYTRHDTNNWSHRSIKGVGIDRHTPELRPDLGHIALGWSSRPIPRQPCGGSHCSLQLAQN
jgi:hypothetical protein